MLESLFNRIGGAAAIGGVVNRLYDRITTDDLIKDKFAGQEMRQLKKHQRAFLTVALGGEDAYSGRDMKSAHAGLAITTAQFNAVATHLADVLSEVGLESDLIREVMTVVGSLRGDIVQGELVS